MTDAELETVSCYRVFCAFEMMCDMSGRLRVLCVWCMFVYCSFCRTYDAPVSRVAEQHQAA